MKLSSTTNTTFPIISYGIIVATGLYNNSDSTVKVQLQIWDRVTTSLINTYTLPSTFSQGEWVYIGVSVFRTNRIEHLYDIHMVTRTLAGVENQASFLSQNISLECSTFRGALTDGSLYYSKIDNIYLGFPLMSETFMFSGMMNKIMAYSDPMTTVELLDNALRLPVEQSKIYEPDLIASYIIYADGITDHINFGRLSKLSKPPYGLIMLQNLTFAVSPSDPLSFCQYHTVEKE